VRLSCTVRSRSAHPATTDHEHHTVGLGEPLLSTSVAGLACLPATVSRNDPRKLPNFAIVVEHAVRSGPDAG